MFRSSFSIISLWFSSVAVAKSRPDLVGHFVLAALHTRSTCAPMSISFCFFLSASLASDLLSLDCQREICVREPTVDSPQHLGRIIGCFHQALQLGHVDIQFWI